jgi:DNA-binding PadR family transcriptional regulator
VNLLEYYVLLALSSGPRHGYAIKDAVAADSGGAETPRAGNLYRVIARLITSGWVRESQPSDAPARLPHPGVTRRYYALSASGRKALAEQTVRLKDAARAAEKRLRNAPGRS